MPEPIKSMQSLPIAADLVFLTIPGEESATRAELKLLGKEIAKDLPQYSAETEAEAAGDEQMETRAQREENQPQEPSVDVCAAVDAVVAKSKARALALAKTAAKASAAAQGAAALAVPAVAAVAAPAAAPPAVRKYSAAQVHRFNDVLVEAQLSPARRLCKAERHERFARLYEAGILTPDTALNSFVNHGNIKAARRAVLLSQGSKWLDDGSFGDKLTKS